MSRGALQKLHRRSRHEKRTKIIFCTQSKIGSENRSSHFEPKISWISFSRGSGPPLNVNVPHLSTLTRGICTTNNREFSIAKRKSNSIQELETPGLHQESKSDLLTEKCEFFWTKLRGGVILWYKNTRRSRCFPKKSKVRIRGTSVWVESIPVPFLWLVLIKMVLWELVSPRMHASPPTTWIILPQNGRAASAGALASQPLRTLHNQLEYMQIFSKTPLVSKFSNWVCRAKPLHLQRTRSALGPGQFLVSYVVNWVLTTRLFQWLGWVGEN